jgi:hypothetical protein
MDLMVDGQWQIVNGYQLSVISYQLIVIRVQDSGFRVQDSGFRIVVVLDLIPHGLHGRYGQHGHYCLISGAFMSFNHKSIRSIKEPISPMWFRMSLLLQAAINVKTGEL